MRSILLLAVGSLLSGCTTVTNPNTGFRMPWIAQIPFDSTKPGAPSTAKSGVRVYTGTVNGQGYTAIIPH